MWPEKTDLFRRAVCFFCSTWTATAFARILYEHVIRPRNLIADSKGVLSSRDNITHGLIGDIFSSMEPLGHRIYVVIDEVMRRKAQPVK